MPQKGNQIGLPNDSIAFTRYFYSHPLSRPSSDHPRHASPKEENQPGIRTGRTCPGPLLPYVYPQTVRLEKKDLGAGRLFLHPGLSEKILTGRKTLKEYPKRMEHGVAIVTK